MKAQSVRVRGGMVHRVAVPADQSWNGKLLTACGRFLEDVRDAGPWVKYDVESCYRCRIARSPRLLDLAQRVDRAQP